MPPGRFSHRTPPWWPEGEPWPPQGGPNLRRWQGMRGRFFRRMGCSLFLMLLLAVGVFNAVFWLAANNLGWIQPPDHTFGMLRGVAGFVLVIGLASIWLVTRSLRRSALPFGDLLEAVGRIADGDYSVRLPEGSPGDARGLAGAFNAMAARLQSSDEQRRRLLADVTHELRTPITVIQGNLEGMLDGIYPPDPAHLQMVLEETQILSRMIDDMRTLSLVESGALKLEIEPSDIGDLLRDAAASFEPQVRQAGIHLEVTVQPGLPALPIDPTRIREVLANLLSNALRYTPPGGRIVLHAWSEQQRPDQVLIAVQDNGSGISPEDLPFIFDRFYKSSQSRGTGLGLAIAKNLVSAHHGEIFAESQPGQGTTIKFSLPIAGS